MSLFSGLGVAASGMGAQAKKIRTTSGNVANVETAGYKQRQTEFNAMVLGGKQKAPLVGGVTTLSRTDIAKQGALRITEQNGDIAVNGTGFFLVKPGTGKELTLGAIRTGAFRPDKDGYLVNGMGYYLQGQRYKSGEAIMARADALEAIQIPAELSGATKKVLFNTKLAEGSAADAVVNDTATVYDADGKEYTVQVTFTAKADGSWTVEAAVGTMAAGTLTPLAADENLFTVDTAGSLISPDDAVSFTATPQAGAAPDWTDDTQPTKIDVRWTFGGSVQTIELDLSGVRKVAAGDTSAASPQTSAIQTGGYTKQAVIDWSVSQQGVLAVTLDNGNAQEIYKLPMANCLAPNNLTEKSGGVYTPNINSGEFTYAFPETDSLGSVGFGALEASTVDVASELSDMIVTQYAYSANTKVISTISQMLDALMRL
ncbi:MAG: flagellar hook-basal body complex protein [Holosporales bacterium]|jgi:flagellar hook protein FlgE|nr:flagellar hook-basal body complex protein [Holosporales bacterium]